MPHIALTMRAALTSTAARQLHHLQKRHPRVSFDAATGRGRSVHAAGEAIPARTLGSFMRHYRLGVHADQLGMADVLTGMVKRRQQKDDVYAALWKSVREGSDA